MNSATDASSVTPEDIVAAAQTTALVQGLLEQIVTGADARVAEIAEDLGERGEAFRSVPAAVRTPGSVSAKAERLGDVLAEGGAHRDLVNECYRTAFYAGPFPARLADNPLYANFLAQRLGPPVDKWIHYFPVYHRHLASFRGKPVRLLEIGVYHGGGLKLWRGYLGEQAAVVGIDIDEGAKAAAGNNFAVEIGDQSDPAFLSDVVAKHGPFDIVIDDGGHTSAQQQSSLEILFPVLRDGGKYIVEDCHTSYWSDYLDADVSFLDWARRLVDDMHAYHRGPDHRPNDWTRTLSGLMFHDSVVVLEKELRWAPFSEMSGTGEFLRRTRDQEAALLDARLSRDAVNRELNQTNHELDSTNSALATTNEELNRANEELHRVNGEMNRVNHELSATCDQLARQLQDSELARRKPWRRLRPGTDGAADVGPSGERPDQ